MSFLVVVVLLCFTWMLLVASRSANAFTVPIAAGPSRHHPSIVILGMSEGTSSAEMQNNDDGNTSSVEEEEEGEKTSQPPTENPEVIALKEEISKLEAKLAYEKSKLEAALEECEEYSKTGYARKVADMENMKRVRSNIASTSRSSATAAVLRDFMPAYDTLNNLQQKYANDEFGSKYSELNLQQTFTNLGVTNFTVMPGDKVNNFRMKVLEREVSKDFDKDLVIRAVSPGLELDGNVIRAASCVASLGSEEEKPPTEDPSSSDGEDVPAE